ncbi:MAG: DNA polymerase III subunit gamma/tau [Tissierellia bacterium]|nr:DNA polymerase III subunit gamma/tau [Tissierellia bacterium]
MQALYRKYRPLTFDQVYGQEAVVKILKNQIMREDTSHAYLFAGSRGTGKTSVAKILARALNCEDPREGNPCNQCPSCRGIMEERILDVVEMDAASNNGVDDIRDLKDKVIYAPSMVKKRVYIIDEVHMLSKGAFNALLKILEEPPSHLVFILATTEPERIPATIISRTQRYHFHRISQEDLVANMASILEEEGLGYDQEALSLIAAHSDGAMRDALSILDQCMGLGQDKIRAQWVVKTLGLTEGETLRALVEGVTKKDAKSILRELRKAYGRGKNMGLLLEDLVGYYRDMMVSLATGQLAKSRDQALGQAILSQAQTLGMERIFASIDLLVGAMEEVRFSQDPLLLLEVTSLKLLGLGQETLASPPRQDQETRRPLQEEKPEAQGPSPEKKAPQPSPGESPPLKKEAGPAIIEGEKEPTAIKAIWSELIQDLSDRHKSLALLLEGGEIVSFERDLLTYGFKKEDQAKIAFLEPAHNKDPLEEGLSKKLGRPIRVHFVSLAEAQPPDPDQALVDLFGQDHVKFID